MLAAHQIIFLINFFFNFESLKFETLLPKYFKFPTTLIFFAPSNFKYFFVSKFCGNAMVTFLNIFFEKFGKYFHLLKDFLVILALRIIKGILFLYKFLYIFGQTSESTKIAIFGFQ